MPAPQLPHAMLEILVAVPSSLAQALSPSPLLTRPQSYSGMRLG